MRGLAGGLIFVSFATVAGLLFGIVGHGLTAFIASAAFTVGIFAATLAYLKTTDPRPEPAIVHDDVPWFRYRDTWKWLVAFCFAIFAVRSFCWLFYIDGDQFYIQSPNNLGDLALHLTFIKNFANGVSLWPDNPIFDGSKLRYPAGIDLFNALLSFRHVDLMSWSGLVYLVRSLLTTLFIAGAEPLPLPVSYLMAAWLVLSTSGILSLAITRELPTSLGRVFRCRCS